MEIINIFGGKGTQKVLTNPTGSSATGISINNEFTHTHYVNLPSYVGDSAVPKSDATNGTPRTGVSTRGKLLGGEFYY